MRRLLFVSLVAALAHAQETREIVLAEPGFRIVPPEGWTPTPEAAASLVTALEDEQHQADGTAWTSKGGGLFVLWRIARAPIEGDAAPAVQKALDAFSERKGNVVDSSRAVGDWDATAFVTAEPERGALLLARTTVFLDGKRKLREIRVECVLRKEALAAARPACETALASFALAVPDEELSPIKAKAAAPPAPPAVPPVGAPVVPAPPAASERPWWAGPGLVVVVLLLPVLAFLGYRLVKDQKK